MKTETNRHSPVQSGGPLTVYSWSFCGHNLQNKHSVSGLLALNYKRRRLICFYEELLG